MPGDLESEDSSSEDASGDDSSFDDEGSFSETNGEDEDKSSAASENSVNETEEINNMLRKESKDVLMWREIVTGMLVITAALVTITTYVLLSRQEVDVFTNGVSCCQFSLK